MGGLAIGAWQAGRIAASVTPARAPSDLRVPGIAIAVCARLLPLVLSAARPVLSGRKQTVKPAASSISRSACSRCCCSRPRRRHGRDVSGGRSVLRRRTANRGGSAARHPPFVRKQGCGGERAGGLYAANTAGAAAGAAVSGFVLLPMLGAQGDDPRGRCPQCDLAVGATVARGAQSRRVRSAAPAYVRNRTARRPGSEKRTGEVIPRSGPAAPIVWPPWRWRFSGWSRSSIKWPGRDPGDGARPTAYAFSAMLVAFITVWRSARRSPPP